MSEIRTLGRRFGVKAAELGQAPRLWVLFAKSIRADVELYRRLRVQTGFVDQNRNLVLGTLIEKIKQFAVDFRELHIESGSPAYSKLAAQIGYSKATLSLVFKGENLPNWVVLEALLRNYGCDEQTVSDWLKRWTSIKRWSDLVLAGVDPIASVNAKTKEPALDMTGW